MENNVENVTPVAENMPVTPAAPVAEPVKKSASKILVPCILVGILVVLLVAGIVVKSVMSSPKRVFTNVVNKAYKEVSTTLKEIDEFYKPEKEAIEMGGTIKFNTNYDLSEFGLPKDLDISKVELGGKFGIDLPKKEIVADADVKGSSEKLGIKAYVKEDKVYLKPSFYDKTIEVDLDEAAIKVDDYKDALDEAEEVDIDLVLYDSILKAYKDAMIDAFDKDAMSKDKDEIEVLDKELKVTKNSYKLNDKSVQKLAKGIIENLLEDKSFIKNVAKAANMEESEIKDTLKEAKKSCSDIKIGSVIVVNVYTRGLLNKYAGFDITADKVEIMSWYTDGDNIEATINAGQKIKFTVEKGKKESKAKLVVGDKKIATATIRSFTEEEVDFDYEINLGEFSSQLKEVKGTVKVTAKKDKKKYSGDYKFKVEYDGKWAEVSGTYFIEAKSSLDGLSTSDAVKADAVDGEAISKALEETITKDETFNQIKDIVTKYMQDKASSNGGYNIPTTPSDVQPTMPDYNQAQEDIDNNYNYGY